MFHSDRLLYKSRDIPTATEWMPQDPTTLAKNCPSKPFESIVSTVHYDDFMGIYVNDVMKPKPVSPGTYLHKMLPNVPVLWFAMPESGQNWYGNVSFVVDLQKCLQIFKKCYFLEIIEYQTTSA